MALTLRLLGGLTTDEIARAFLVPEPTVAQRIVRAKKTLAKANVPFEVPEGDDRDARLASVLEVIYLIFNEGYSATAGDDWMRPALCEEALRLGRVLAGLAPKEPEVHGLVALMEIQASRLARAHRPGRRARAAARPEPRALGPAADPPRPRGAAPRRGARRRARPLRAPGGHRRLPRARPTPADTDWALIARSTGRSAISPVAGRRAEPGGRGRHGGRAGGRAGLVDTLIDEPRCRATTCCRACAATCWSSSAADEARAEFERAAGMTRNARERELLLERAACVGLAAMTMIFVNLPVKDLDKSRTFSRSSASGSTKQSPTTPPPAS